VQWSNEDFKGPTEQLAANLTKIRRSSTQVVGASPYKLPYHKVRPSDRMVEQAWPMSCGPACVYQLQKDKRLIYLPDGEKYKEVYIRDLIRLERIKEKETLLGRTLTSEELDQIEVDAYAKGFLPEELAEVLNKLNPEEMWFGSGFYEPPIDLERYKKSWIASVKLENGSAHAVIVDKVEGNLVYIRDPQQTGLYTGLEGTMNIEDFMRIWAEAEYGTTMNIHGQHLSIHCGREIVDNKTGKSRNVDMFIVFLSEEETIIQLSYYQRLFRIALRDLSEIIDYIKQLFPESILSIANISDKIKQTLHDCPLRITVWYWVGMGKSDSTTILLANTWEMEFFIYIHGNICFLNKGGNEFVSLGHGSFTWAIERIKQIYMEEHIDGR
jgi:predicted double-glycine peptidase